MQWQYFIVGHILEVLMFKATKKVKSCRSGFEQELQNYKTIKFIRMDKFIPWSIDHSSLDHCYS